MAFARRQIIVHPVHRRLEHVLLRLDVQLVRRQNVDELLDWQKQVLFRLGHFLEVLRRVRLRNVEKLVTTVTVGKSADSFRWCE